MDSALPPTEDAWDGLSLFVYERWARENSRPLTISETGLRPYRSSAVSRAGPSTAGRIVAARTI
ncbi:MAG: hypothetical protein ACLU3I_21940 [Acutalibacteraceae bacterium]